jgi:hypothetical protein
MENFKQSDQRSTENVERNTGAVGRMVRAFALVAAITSAMNVLVSSPSQAGEIDPQYSSEDINAQSMESEDGFGQFLADNGLDASSVTAEELNTEFDAELVSLQAEVNQLQEKLNSALTPEEVISVDNSIKLVLLKIKATMIKGEIADLMDDTTSK